MFYFRNPPSLSQFPVNGPNPRLPQWYPYEERHPSTEHSTSHPVKIHLSHRVPSKGAPASFPNRVVMERDTPSPDPLVYLLIFVCRSPPKGALVQNREKLKVTDHGAPRTWMDYIRWGAAWFPKGIVNDTVISTQMVCSPRHDTFHRG
jgi:hypothetical protein